MCCQWLGENPWGDGWDAAAASCAQRSASAGAGLVPQGSAQRKPDRGCMNEPKVYLNWRNRAHWVWIWPEGTVCWLSPRDRDGAVRRELHSVSSELLSSSCKFLSVKRFRTETFGLMFCQQWEMVVEVDREAQNYGYLSACVRPWGRGSYWGTVCVAVWLGVSV